MSTCIGLVTYGLAVVCNGVTGSSPLNQCSKPLMFCSACGDVHYAKLETAPILIGILTFSMEGIYVLPAVYDSMRDPRKVHACQTKHNKTETKAKQNNPKQYQPNPYLKRPSPLKFGIVLDLAYATATAVSAVFGMCAYYIWGPETAAVVATNLPRYLIPLFLTDFDLRLPAAVREQR
jgi:hypothetical protein